MNKSVLVFVPDKLRLVKTGFLNGFYKNFEDSEAFFITGYEIQEKYFSTSIGYVGNFSKNSMYMKEKTLYFDINNHRLIINGERYKNENVIQVTYDFEAFKNSDVIYSNYENYGIHIRALTDKLKDHGGNSAHKPKESNFWLGVFVLQFINFILKLLLMGKPLISHLETFSQLQENLYTFKWFLSSLLKEKKVSIKLGNAFFAKLVDLMLGIMFVKLLLRYEGQIVGLIENTFEEIITNLKRLLIYLMGSPIGLKLNYAFNHSLGTFFFYHINLWRVFLLAMQPLLYHYFKYIVMLGAVGFSFQIAMVCDIISIATFHVYCIYVYAARLFSVQIKGLSSLWRLFIGRKYNPLRDRIDSCEYSPNQLFIGTLGFTVLLFLLPTTTMYYTVFATFRLVILFSTSILSRTRYFLNSLPVYIMVLWLFNSPSMAGTLYIKWKNGGDGANIVNIEAKMKTLPLTESISKFAPDSKTSTQTVALGSIFHNVIVGTLI